MKKNILIYIGFLSLSINCFSQEMIKKGNSWITSNYMNISTSPFQELVGQVLYEIPILNADTSFFGNDYLKLNKDSTLFGLIRETIDSIVYFLPTDSLNEYVLYDFGADVGDTIYNVITLSGSVDMVVYDKFASEMLVGSDGLGNDYWIYFVGGQEGLMETDGTIFLGGHYELFCMSDISHVIYPSGSTLTPPCKKQIISEINTHKNDSTIKLYPNPFDKSFVIENDLNLEYDVHIYNYIGLQVYEVFVNKKQIIIDNKIIESLPSGLYLISVEDKKNNEVYVSKIIKK